MDLKRYLVRNALLAFLCLFGFSVLFFVYSFRSEYKSVENSLEFASGAVKSTLDHLYSDVNYRFDILASDLETEGRPRLSGFRLMGVFYLLDGDGRVVKVSSKALSCLVGIVLPKDEMRSGIVYSPVLDSLVVRKVKNLVLNGKSYTLVYEERFRASHPIRSAAEEVLGLLEKLPFGVNVLVVDVRSSRIVYSKDGWSLLVERPFSSRFKDIFGFRVVELGGKRFLFGRAYLSVPGWALYVLAPFRMFLVEGLKRLSMIAVPALLFVVAIVIMLIRTSGIVNSDVSSVISVVDRGSLERGIFFNELRFIADEILRHKKAVLEYEWYLKFLLASTDRVILFYVEDRGVVLWSRDSERFFGFPDVDGALSKNPWLLSVIREALSSGRAIERAGDRVDVVGAEPLGKKVVNVSCVPFDLDGTRGCIVEVEDTTEEIERQRRLTTSHKMESLGVLAGGVAHDFNNIVGVILGYTQMLKEKLKGIYEEGIEFLGVIEKQCFRAADLVKQLLDFARAAPGKLVAVDLKPVVKEFIRFVSKVVPSDVSIEYHDDGARSYVVKGDVSKINQVLMNLVLNACDAMPDGGKLWVRLKKSSLDDRGFVVLEVEDTGVGIPAEIMDRIFDPFFTTKGSKGTGLGLSQVYGIVEEHGGFVDVESEVGKGAKFSVFIPAAPEKPERMEDKSSQAEVGRSGCLGVKVVVVEDSEELLDVLSALVKELGGDFYGFRSVSSFKEWFEGGGEVDVAFVDIMLPDGKGYSISRMILERNPKAHVILMSGGVGRDEALSHCKGLDFLAKPFSAYEFRKKLEEACRKFS